MSDTSQLGNRIDSHKHMSASSSRRPKPKSTPTILLAVQAVLSTLPAVLFSDLSLNVKDLLSTAPKRWVVYPPMVLLPSGSFSSTQWTTLLCQIAPEVKSSLWTAVLDHISQKEGKGTLTHLAINNGIPSHVTQLDDGAQTENDLRSPSGLTMLHGDFGPAPSTLKAREPTHKDFEEAFWVSTKQNGVTQVWAPRWTMFSRGNVGEKGRLLDFARGQAATGDDGPNRDMAVDLYAGIGYFVFSYVKMGMARVLGWEMNPWSVEGLRRGAMANRWGVRIVKHGEDVEELGDETIVVFLEDNSFASSRMQRLCERSHVNVNVNVNVNVRHVNCGLLPTSRRSWELALGMVKHEGWLHLHENVGVKDVETRSTEVERLCSTWLQQRDGERQAKIEHVEYVKTFAPGVWHIVFDIHLSSSKNKCT